MLILPIKKKWFDMIASGEKEEEYREIKTYWASRFFDSYIKSGMSLEYILDSNKEIYRYIILRNGYRKNSPQIRCYCHIHKGQGKEEWGAEKGKLYYVLKILRVEKENRRC